MASRCSGCWRPCYDIWSTKGLQSMFFCKLTSLQLQNRHTALESSCHGMVLNTSSMSSSACKISLALLNRYQNMSLIARSVTKSVEHTFHLPMITIRNTSRGNSTLPYWPRHARDESQNMVLNSNHTYIEPDTFRSAEISFPSTIDRELLA